MQVLQTGTMDKKTLPFGTPWRRADISQRHPNCLRSAISSFGEYLPIRLTFTHYRGSVYLHCLRDHRPPQYIPHTPHVIGHSYCHHRCALLVTAGQSRKWLSQRLLGRTRWSYSRNHSTCDNECCSDCANDQVFRVNGGILWRNIRFTRSANAVWILRVNPCNRCMRVKSRQFRTPSA
jgi:hypothetical protein